MSLLTTLHRRLALWILPGALLGLPHTSQAPDHPDRRSDPRVGHLEAFFDRYGCPEPYHASIYVRAADEHGIDYRLLPAISLLESTCGAFQRLNNHWGWNNADSGFESVAAGIDHITHQLAHGRPYRGRDLDGKLLSYNRSPAYGPHVKRVMRQIENYSAPPPNSLNAEAGF
jgi:hypothetical protein